MRYLSARRAASTATSKQCDGERGATIGSGASPWRPNIASSRSVCSVLVGMPVDGPARCTSTTSSGSSRLIARPSASAFRSRPGPDVPVAAERPGERGTDRDRRRGDLVLGLHRAHTEALVPAQLVEDVRRRRDRVAGVDQRQTRRARRRPPDPRRGPCCR